VAFGSAPFRPRGRLPFTLPLLSPRLGAPGAAKLPIVSVPRVGFESITRSGKPVTPVRRGRADRLSWTGQIRRDTTEPRQESPTLITV